MPEGGFCDLHCHLLYGLDDGARTLPESIEMARILLQLGFSTVAPSPHNRPEYAPRNVASARLHEMQATLIHEGIELALHPNSENFFLDETLIEKLSTDEARPLGSGKYLLIEAPYTSPLPSLPDLIFRIKLKGFTPLIAHPERCFEFEKKGRAQEAVDAGALLQLDLGAVIGRYGPKARKLARQLLDDGLYAVAATDVHAPVGAAEWLERSLTELSKRVGASAFELLLRQNPNRILRSDSLES